MKVYLIRGNAIMNCLIKEIKITCGNNKKSATCIGFCTNCEKFFFTTTSLSEKKRCIKNLNERIDLDVELFSIKCFFDYFDLINY